MPNDTTSTPTNMCIQHTHTQTSTRHALTTGERKEHEFVSSYLVHTLSADCTSMVPFNCDSSVCLFICICRISACSLCCGSFVDIVLPPLLHERGLLTPPKDEWYYSRFNIDKAAYGCAFVYLSTINVFTGRDHTKHTQHTHTKHKNSHTIRKNKRKNNHTNSLHCTTTI